MKTKNKPNTAIIRYAIHSGIRTAAELAHFLRQHHYLMGTGR